MSFSIAMSKSKIHQSPRLSNFFSGPHHSAKDPGAQQQQISTLFPVPHPDIRCVLSRLYGLTGLTGHLVNIFSWMLCSTWGRWVPASALGFRGILGSENAVD
jgi:hypothetical protein